MSSNCISDQNCIAVCSNVYEFIGMPIRDNFIILIMDFPILQMAVFYLKLHECCSIVGSMTEYIDQ